MSNTAAVTDGKIENTSITSTKVDTKGSTRLGKDAFLQLLVAQMQYQDPLEPTSDTEWISQLAQFSSLEEMQNMSAALTNSQAFSMVGKTVSINTGSGTKEGVVDYVTMSGNKTYVSVDGNKYLTSDIEAVLGESYLAKIYGPQVAEAKATYDHDNPKDLSFEVSLGKDSYAATGMYVALDGKLVDGSYLSYDEKKQKLTIAAEAFSGLKSGGTYDISFIFDNPAETVVTGTVSVTVKGTQPADDKENSDTETSNGETSNTEISDGANDKEITEVTKSENKDQKEAASDSVIKNPATET